MGDAAKVGMMEGAFFVGRSELINWVNDTLQLSISKVEQCATGAIYAQIVDACRPGSVQMSKLKWNAKSEPEYVQNFKVLQVAFAQLKCDRHIEVQKLVRGKYQDNLEMLQWIRAFYLKADATPGYEPVRRRGKLPSAGLPDWLSASEAPPRAPKDSRPSSGRSGREGVSRAVPERASQTSASKELRADRERAAPSRARASTLSDDKAELQEAKKEIRELRMSATELESERDFYFNKLREIEIICQNHDADGSESTLTLPHFVRECMRIMYQTADTTED